jgi:transposase-like protein
MLKVVGDEATHDAVDGRSLLDEIAREGARADIREQAREAITRFATEYGPKYPKAVTTLEKDADALLTFFDFPAEHWKHLRTSNVIESPFATVRLRQRVTKGAGSRTKGLLMAYKLLDMAQARWRRLDGAHLLPLVQAGITFVDGVQHATAGRRWVRGPPDSTRFPPDLVP